MNPRENVLAAMRRQNPEYVPFMLQFTPPMQKVFECKFGVENPAEHFDFDVRIIGFPEPEILPDYSIYYPQEFPAGSYLDEWGIMNVPGSMYHFTKMVHPLRNASDPEEILSYPLPEYAYQACYHDINSETAQYQGRGYAVIGSLEMTIFEVSWYLRGLENLLQDMVIRPEMASALLDRITSLREVQAEIFARAGVDILALGDDIAMQTGMLMSPKMWRKWFKSRLRSVVESARKFKPDLLIWYHTDGDCRQVISDLIEVGVDILNPVQPECMNPVAIKIKYGDQLSFSGTIGTQSTMPFGKPNDVRHNVAHMINTVGAGGGLLLAPTHVLEPDVPWDNVMAFVDAAREYGRY